LYGISCRNYETAAAAVPGAIGLSSSSVSRTFTRASAQQLQALQDRDLSGIEWSKTCRILTAADPCA
jgi:hypothetical protein